MLLTIRGTLPSVIVRLAVAIELLGENEPPATGPAWLDDKDTTDAAQWCVGEETLRVAR